MVAIRPLSAQSTPEPLRLADA
ncbi:MAG: hypothetical protein RLZZ621_210, partial [Gemmatimonadota bacterium]